MSLLDTTTCYSFGTNQEELDNLKDKDIFVILKHNLNKYVFKVHITDIVTSIDHYNHNHNGNDYYAFNIIYKKSEKNLIGVETKKYFFGIFKKIIKIYKKVFKEYEMVVKNRMYSEDFYSFFSPSGFLYKDNLFYDKNEIFQALNFTEYNEKFISSSSSLYPILINNLDKSYNFH